MVQGRLPTPDPFPIDNFYVSNLPTGMGAIRIIKKLLRFDRTILEFSSASNLDRTKFSSDPKCRIPITIFRPGFRRHPMQIISFSRCCEKGNIDVLVKLYHETLPLIARIGNSRFECFIGGTPKPCGKHQNGQCKTYQSRIAPTHFSRLLDHFFCKYTRIYQ